MLFILLSTKHITMYPSNFGKIRGVSVCFGINFVNSTINRIYMLELHFIHVQNCLNCTNNSYKLFTSTHNCLKIIIIMLILYNCLGRSKKIKQNNVSLEEKLHNYLNPIQDCLEYLFKYKKSIKF